MDVLMIIDKLDDLVHKAKQVPLRDQVRVDKQEYVSLAFVQAARDDRPLDGLQGRLLRYSVAESFFATLKKELVHRQPWPTRRELSSAVFDCVEAFYSRLAKPPSTEAEFLR